ncbi:hypothetical protein [Enorma burkinafasonensis]|uniref:hypothetical protein n=1 Tax=Enorma burkinafasonensis TaxID=2590867 RepID=UPI0011A9F52C|nr:hypothetical protein [Enorma burkinafasonensis]
MAWSQTPRYAPDIDPFNAPDPIMPTDEPGFEAPDMTDGAERLRAHEAQRRHEQARREVEHHQRHAWHRRPASTAPQQASAILSQLRSIIVFFVVMMLIAVLLPLVFGLLL